MWKSAVGNLTDRLGELGGNTLGVRQEASASRLYGGHLGFTSASSGAAATSERYYAYGKDRGTGNLPTNHRFTKQISDASGLIFMNARFYTDRKTKYSLS